jgi:DNA damage-binding protein 1
VVPGPTPFVILGDKQGRLSVLTYPIEGHRASASLAGTVSPPSCISYLDAGIVFIGSESGDCEIIRLALGSSSTEPLARSPTKGKGKAVELTGIQEEGATTSSRGTSFTLIDTWTNVAPIKDFCVVSEETYGGDGGANQIVTASGQASGASIRVIRSGVGAEEMVVLEGLQDVVAVWPIHGLQGKGYVRQEAILQS